MKEIATKKISQQTMVVYDNLGSYNQDIRDYENWLSEQGKPVNYDFDNIKQYCCQYSNANSRQKKVKAFKRFFANNIQNTKLLEIKKTELDTLNIQNEQKQAPDNYLTREEVDYLVSFVRTKQVNPKQYATKTGKIMTSNKVDETKYYKLSLIIAFLFQTGLRIDELINIELNSLKLNGIASFTVLGKGSKCKGKKQRHGSCKRDLYDSIRLAFQGKKYLFETSKNTKLNQGNLFRDIQKLGKEAFPEGLDDNRKAIGLHTFRHSYAIHLIESGVSIDLVSKLLGHASVNTTMIYLRRKPDMTSILGNF